MYVAVNGVNIGQCYKLISSINSKCIAYSKKKQIVELISNENDENNFGDKWYFKALPDNYFTIRNRSNHCTLSIDADKTSLVLDKSVFHGINESNSFIINHKNNTISITNKAGLSINGTLALISTTATPNKDTSSSLSLFQIKAVSDCSLSSTNLYRLRSETLRFIDLEDQTADTTSCYAWTENGEKSQIWSIKKGAFDGVFIVNYLNGRCLDIYGSQREEGANIRVSNIKEFAFSNQLWRLEWKQENGCFKLRSLHNTAMVLDIAGSDNKTLLIWESNTGGNQRFTFEPYFTDRPLNEISNDDDDDNKTSDDDNNGWFIEKQSNENKFCLFGDQISDRKNHEYDYRAFCVQWFAVNDYTHLIASASPDHTVKLWRIDNNDNNNKNRDKTRKNITAFVELSAPGWINNMKVISHDASDSIQIIVTIREDKIYKYDIPKQYIYPFLVNNNNEAAATANNKGDIIRQSIDLPFGPNERCFDISNDGKRCYIGFNEHCSVKLAGKKKSCLFVEIDLESGTYKKWSEIADNVQDFEYIDCLKINKDSSILGIGTRNASGLKNGQFIIAEINKNGDIEKIKKSVAFPCAITAVEWSVNNELIIIGENNGNVLILNAELKELHSFRSHYQKISNLSLVDDLLAVSSNDGDVTIHDLAAFLSLESVEMKESVEIIDIEAIHGGGRVESIELSPNYANKACAGQYLLSCAYGKLDQVHVRDICMILRFNVKESLLQKRRDKMLKNKIKENETKIRLQSKLTRTEIDKLDAAYKDVSGAWLDLWKNAGRMLNIVSSLSKPIFESLKDDKFKYLQIYNKEIIGNTTELAYYQGTDSIYGVTEKLAEIEYHIKKKQEYENKTDEEEYIMIEKQSESDLVKLRTNAKGAHLAIQELARDLAEAVHGHYEGDPGIKKVPRCVEKMCTRQIQKLKLNDLNTNWTETNDWKLEYDILKDIARGGVLLPDMKSIRDALFKLQQWQTGEYGANKIIEIMRIKNRFDPGFNGIFGYRDLLINIRFLNPLWLKKNKWKEIFDDINSMENGDTAKWIQNGKYEWKEKRGEIIKELNAKKMVHFDNWNMFWNLICDKEEEKTPHKYLYGSHIIELQLHHEKIHLIRQSGNGHTNYSNSRFMIDFVMQMKSIRKQQNKDPQKEKIFQLIQQLKDVSLE